MPRQATRGQVLVIFALALVVLLGSAAFTIDLGRHAAEDRFLQNAADAGALAGCRALTGGASQDSARQEAYAIAIANLGSSPAGDTVAPFEPNVDALVYADGYPGQPAFLESGILADGSSVRVAIRATIPTTLARVLGFEQLDASARARCQLDPSPALPIVARRYAAAPGPGNGFVDHLATTTTSGNGRVDATNVLGYDGRTPASMIEPGPVFALFGPDAKASNDSQFRGFIALDIRDFETPSSRQHYNGVAPGTNPNSIAESCSPNCNGQASYILAPYPGPAFPPITSPPNPDDQVAVIDGNKSAQVPVNFDQRFNVGDEVLVSLYNGTVMEIPDFTLSMTSAIDVTATGTIADGPLFTVSRNSAFFETVDLTLEGDTAAPDPAYNLVEAVTTAPSAGHMNTPTFSPDTFLPDDRRGTDVRIQGIETNTVPEGVYTVWLKGTSSLYASVRRVPISVRVGGAQPDFAVTVGAGDAPVLGDTATVPIYVTTANNGTTAWNGGGVTLAVDPASLPAGMTASQISFDVTTVAPRTNTNTRSATMSIQTAAPLAPGSHTVHLRVRGTSSSGRPVTHLQAVTFTVASVSSQGRYVDVIGFGVFRITDIRSNAIDGQAISPVYDRPDHEALNRFRRPRLISWCLNVPSPCSEG